MEAKGEHFDTARLIPPKVPDDQNFAMTPYFAPLFDLPPEVLRAPIKFVTNTFDGTPVVGVLGLPKLGTDLGTYAAVLYSPNLNPRDHPPHLAIRACSGFDGVCQSLRGYKFRKG